jgi:hypothetical protein
VNVSYENHRVRYFYNIFFLLEYFKCGLEQADSSLFGETSILLIIFHNKFPIDWQRGVRVLEIGTSRCKYIL